MLSSILTLALFTLNALAAGEEKRQATDAAQFTSAADELIAQYIPATALSVLEASVSSAASAASVTGEPLSLIYDGLLAMSLPGWFSSAIPGDMSTQIGALASKINALRPGPTGGSVTVIAITTTDSAGSTITTSSTSTLPSSTVTTTTTSGVTATTTATTTTGGSGSGAGSTLSTLTTEVINGATSVFSVAVSGASSVVNKASSVVGDASSAVKSASSAAGASPTNVPGHAAGVLGLLGLIAVL